MTADQEIHARSIIERIDEGVFPREFLLQAARGFLPFEQDEVISVLAHLAVNGDPEVADAARATLGEMPVRSLTSFASGDLAGPRELEALSVAMDDPGVLESVLRNRRTDDHVFVTLAGRVSPHLQDVIIINQERILRTPAILDALEGNPSLSSDVRRRALEVREEFFHKRPITLRAPEPAGVPEEDAAGDEAIADLLERAESEEDGSVAATVPPPEPENADEESIFVKLLHMTPSQKVKLAYRGGRTERSLLIRERSRLVCTAVMRSPRLTESEVESFAAMRNVEEEVLRIIGTNREWMSKYPILLNLVRNPKAPIGVVLPLVHRLTLRDLKNLSSDKNVSEGVRVSAKRLYNARKST